MKPTLPRLLWPFAIAAILLMSSACTSNSLYRTDAPQDCQGNTCDKAFIEHHHNADENYDLAFVEFSERGNVFDRGKMEEVIKYVDQQEQNAPNGIMLILFTHGWQNDASKRPGNNVHNFRNMLKMVSTQFSAGKKVIGVYVGWRGLSTKVYPFKLLTYWDRKNAARQAGNGGVSELLLRLNEITKRGYGQNHNTFIMTGHSFGAAVMLEALKDPLLERIVSAKKVDPAECSDIKADCASGCYKTEPFGDATFLINPAVEANEFMQIKELIAEKRCFAKSQPKLLHIISSDRDLPTRFAFTGGQFIGVSLHEAETTLERNLYDGDSSRQIKAHFPELGLDTTTVGNYPPFRTGHTFDASKLSPAERAKCSSDSANQCYIPCEGTTNCLTAQEKQNFPYHFPVAPHEPVSIIYGDRDFMNGHSDIFNHEVMGYVAAAVVENQYKKTTQGILPEIQANCTKTKAGQTGFDFTTCRSYFNERYTESFKQQKADSK